MNKARVTPYIAALMLIVFAGCSQQTAPVKQHPLEVGVVKDQSVKSIGEKQAARMKLNARYDEAMRLDARGEHKQARDMLVSVAEDARSANIDFPDQIAQNLDRARSGRDLVNPADQQAEQDQPQSQGDLVKKLRQEVNDEQKVNEPPAEEAEPVDTNQAVELPALLDPKDADKMISVNFDQAEIRVVLKTISDITGANFLIDDNVRGTVSLISPTKMRLGDIYKVLESILEVKGFAAVPSGNLIKIIPRMEAAKTNLNIRVGADPKDIPQNDSLVTQIIPLKYVTTAEIGNLITPLISPDAQLAMHPQTNNIVLTDTSANIHHIARIISEIDTPRAKEKLSIIPLKFASAQSLTQQIMDMVGPQATPPAGPPTATTQERRRIKIIPDKRTNSLIVLASPTITQTIHELVDQLDIQRPMAANNIHVVYLKNANAKDVVQSVSAAVQKLDRPSENGEPLQITADEGTNSLIITASPQEYKVIDDIIEKLDIVREQVLVELRIIEASEEALHEIGIDWSTLDQAVANSIRGFGYTNFGLRLESASGNLEGLALGAFKKTGGGTQIGAILKALQRNSKVNILSTPHILTSNNQEAEILVGENIPYVKESRVTETDPSEPTVIKSYDYKDVGISLKITPHISQNGLVRLAINSEFTKLIEGTAAAGDDTPTTAKRQANTVVSMKSGATVVIGGLMRDDTTLLRKSVPVLGDIPVLGNLFTWRKKLTQKTNLLLFITPHVLADKGDLEKMTQRKNAESGLSTKTF